MIAAVFFYFFFFNDTATTEIYTLSLHDALPISSTNRVVAEYLLAEMLDRQPPDVQDLLLRTSLLDRVNGELADLLTGRLGSERILLELEDANAFTESLDPG